MSPCDDHQRTEPGAERVCQLLQDSQLSQCAEGSHELGQAQTAMYTAETVEETGQAA